MNYDDAWDNGISAKYPNLYAAYRTAADVIPYVKYASPAIRQKFAAASEQEQTNDLLKENLSLLAQVAAGPVGRAVTGGIGSAASKLAPNMYNALTRKLALGGGESLYHGGLGAKATIQDIDPFRVATKQFKRGREYGGFYMGDEGVAGKYAQQGAMPSVHRIDLMPNARVADLESGRLIDRIKVDELKELSKQADVLRGYGIGAKPEQQYILLNKDAVRGVKLVK
jgi:hypothetical protein